MLTYTANDPKAVAQLAAWGVDAIITDAIDVIRPVDLIGSVNDLPPDLSARKKHYLKTKGYGRKRPR